MRNGKDLGVVGLELAEAVGVLGALGFEVAEFVGVLLGVTAVGGLGGEGGLELADPVCFLGAFGAQALGLAPPKMTPDPPYLIFNWLVFLCLDSYDSERRRILQHFSRSTRFAFFCSQLNINIQQHFLQK